MLKLLFRSGALLYFEHAYTFMLSNTNNDKNNSWINKVRSLVMRQKGEFCVSEDTGEKFTFLGSIVEMARGGFSVEVRTVKFGGKAIISQVSFSELFSCVTHLNNFHEQLGSFDVEYLYLPAWISQKRWGEYVSEWMDEKKS